MYKKKDGMPMIGQVGMNSVFGGPRQLDVDSLQDPYSGAMTRMDQGAIDKSNQMFGPLAMRQYGMNMSGPLNKMLPIPKFDTAAQVGNLNPVDTSAIGQTMNYSDAFKSGAFATEAENTTAAQNTNEQPQGVQTLKDAIAATSRPIGETPQSLRQAERTRNTEARIARRDARKAEQGGYSKVGNFLRKTFNQ
jgi:hypothetical protein